MAWIKTHPHLLTLILVALGVLAACGLLVMNAQAFDHNFDAVRQTAPKGTKVYQQAQDAIEAAKAELQSPATWKAPEKRYSLLVSERYMVSEDGKLIEPGVGAKNTDSLTKQPIPDKWFLDHNLSFFTPGVARQDPDGDGFFNEDEWRANTDPNKKESHPALHTKLFLTKFIQVPFRLKFQSVDEEPKGVFSFQINTLDLRQPTAFLKIGDMVPRTKFKIDKYEHKVKTVNDTEVDISELTVTQSETNQSIVLIMNTVVNSPDYYAQFRYLLLPPGKDTFQVKNQQQFVLLPEKEQLYKLLDVSEEKALIQTPSGEKVEIPKLPPGYP